jgi:hypothetical protein
MEISIYENGVMVKLKNKRVSIIKTPVKDTDYLAIEFKELAGEKTNSESFNYTERGVVSLGLFMSVDSALATYKALALVLNLKDLTTAQIDNLVK